jgi:hypothetical protein
MSGRECFEHLDNLIDAWGVLDRGRVLRMDGCEFYLNSVVLEGDGGWRGIKGI